MGSDSKIYALEVCDAVEADELGYQIDGVQVSDFITPAWFEPTCADRMDFKKHVSKELELARRLYFDFRSDQRLDTDRCTGRERSAIGCGEPSSEKEADSTGVEKERR